MKSGTNHNSFVQTGIQNVDLFVRQSTNIRVGADAINIFRLQLGFEHFLFVAACLSQPTNI
jgi:hypothetical protein